MIKVHHGFVDEEVALHALTACIFHYAMHGFLTSCYVKKDTKSFELSVHWWGSWAPELVQGLEPAYYEDVAGFRSDGHQFKVRHMYFSLCKQNPL